MAVTGAEMLWRCRNSWSTYTIVTHTLAVGQFMPAIVTGGLVTLVLACCAPEVLWMLPGLWCIFFSLGIFASFRLLPRATFLVAVFYLAAGLMAQSSLVFAILAVCIGVHEYADFLFLRYIKASEQMAVLAGAMLGACLGFLWFNCSPASVFMGDTGSLAMGGLIGYIAIVIRQELLLVLVGGIFVVEALSVMLQVSYFKFTRKRYGAGRRIFLMAPLHHHFQEKGWPETQVVIRFWLIGAMLAAMGLATVKLR